MRRPTIIHSGATKWGFFLGYLSNADTSTKIYLTTPWWLFFAQPKIQNGGHFSILPPFATLNSLFGTVSQKIVHFNDLSVKLCFSDHAESEFWPPRFTRSYLYRICDGELQYTTLVCMEHGVNPRQLQNARGV